MSTLPGLRWFGRRRMAPRQSPASRIALNQVGHSEGLRFTEWLVVGVLGLAYLLSISQPLFAVQLHRTILNHLPLALLGPALALHFLGVLAYRKALAWSEVFAVCWPLVLLGLYAITGSAVAKRELDIRETYLAFGVYLLLLPLFAALTFNGERVQQWAKVLVFLWVLASCAALAGELSRVKERETLHEIEYLVGSGFFVLYYVSRSAALKLLALLLLVGAAVINHKLTGYIVATMAVTHIVVMAGWRQLPRQWRGAYGLTAVVLTAALVAALTLLYFEYRIYLPSGNPDVRLTQYEAAWRQFIESPLWGNAYLEGSGEEYREAGRVLNIPTHSDVIDILKHGGLIGFGLFAWGYWKIFIVINRAVGLTRADTVLCAFLTGARFFQVTALITFAINPILLKGPYLIVIWGNLGLAFGVALASIRSAWRAASA